MIRFSHTHKDGRECFLMRTCSGSYENILVLTFVSTFPLKGRKMIMAYMSYSGCWYVYDYNTGEELATLLGRDNPIAVQMKRYATAELDSIGVGEC